MRMLVLFVFVFVFIGCGDRELSNGEKYIWGRVDPDASDYLSESDMRELSDWIDREGL